MIPIRLMTARDLPAGLRLSRQAGWNQTEADWRRQFDLQPDGCFVAERDSDIVGTVGACVFGPVGWIAMMLVDEAVRGQGIGKNLMRHALDFLDRTGVRTVRLDATPLGQPLYRKLGFVEEYRLDRYQGLLPGNEVPENAPAAPDRIDDLVALDRTVTGTDRGKLLRQLLAEQPESLRVVRRDDQVEGFLMARPGLVAVQIGPCIADAEAGAILLREAWRTYAGRTVFIDVLTDHAHAPAIARAAGLSIQRHLTRMCRGERVVERRERLWASSGPAKG